MNQAQTHLSAVAHAMKTSRLLQQLGLCGCLVFGFTAHGQTPEPAPKSELPAPAPVAESSAQKLTELADQHLLMEVLHALENPHNVTHVGKRGELGPYQFRPATWRMHTNQPFELANNHELATDVALRHFAWLRRGLEKRGLEPSVYNIALAWNAGLDATLKNRAPSRSHRYAQRAHNLWVDLRTAREKEAAAAAAAQADAAAKKAAESSLAVADVTST